MKNTVQAMEYREDSVVLKIGNLRALWHLTRPTQWTKNLFIFLGILFSNQWNNSGLVIKTIIATIAFSFVSSSVYIMNDLFDIRGSTSEAVTRGKVDGTKWEIYL